MDYLDYRVKYEPLSLPSDKVSIEEPLTKIPIPTAKLDKKRGMDTKPIDEKKYSLYWTAPGNTWSNYNIKEAYKLFVTSWEGGKLTKVSGDRGGLTNNGITIGTWKGYGKDKNVDGKIDEQDLAMMSSLDRDDILQQRFWNAARADEINHPYLAAYVVDWMWGTGPKAFKKMHEAFGLKPLTYMTDALLSKLNANPVDSYVILNNSRKKFYRSIVEHDPSQKKFLKGWLRRADAITLDNFILNT